jgi:Ca-activated chloride channel family protein
VIGTGLYNYKDDKLEVLAKHGNGTYCVVNEQEDVEESVKKRYVSLTNVVAKDVKAQVEFNPRYVASYRLLGYENRSLSHEDFVNDKVISEPYGAGGHGVALYEIVRNDGELKQELKYQTAVLTDSDELCTVKIRYKAPLSEESTEISKAVKAVSGDKIGGNAALAYFLYCLGEKLRKSVKLNKDDEEYFDNMIKDGAYLKLPGGNEDKIKLIAEYLQ